MEVTKKDVENLIELRKKNTFLNHFWNVFSRDFRTNGEINQNEIKVWKQNMWNSFFYPIFTFEFNANNHLIKIKGKLNPIGKTLIGIFVLVFVYLIFPKNLSEFNPLNHWKLMLMITVFICLGVWIASEIYRTEKNFQLEQIYGILGIKTEEKKPKEWSLKNILFRLFTYPFCLFLIGLNIFWIIPNGQYILAVGILGPVGLYLYSDIKMILKN